MAAQDNPIDGLTEYRLDKSAIKAIGPLIAEFRSSKMNLLAGFIVGSLFAIAAVVALGFLLREGFAVGWRMPFYTEEKFKMSWVPMGLGLFCVVACAGGAYLILEFSYTHLTHRVAVHSLGIAYRQSHVQQLIPWTSVARIDEKVLYEKLPIVHAPANWLLPRKKSTSYEVHRNDGCAFEFTVNTIKNLQALEMILREQAAQRSIPWKVVTEYA